MLVTASKKKGEIEREEFPAYFTIFVIFYNIHKLWLR